MGTIETFQLTKSDIEAWLDTAKVSVVTALAKEGYLSWEDVDEWAKTHTVIVRKKNIFRTVSNAWNKLEESDGNYILVVKMPEEIEEDEEDGEKEPLPLEDKGSKVVELKRREA